MSLQPGALPGAVSKCIDELTLHFQTLLARNSALRRENGDLRQQISRPTNPGTVPADREDCSSLSEVVKIFDGELEEPDADAAAFESILPNMPKQQSILGAKVQPRPSDKPLSLSSAWMSGNSLGDDDLGRRVDVSDSKREDLVSAPRPSPITALPDARVETLEVEQNDSPKKPLHVAEAIDTGLTAPLGAARLGMLTAQTAPDLSKEPLRSLQELIRLLCEGSGVPRDAPLRLRLAESGPFRCLCMIAVMSNAIYLATATDSNVRRSYLRVTNGAESSIPESKYAEIAFAVWFSIELLIRLVGHDKGFFFGENKVWNLFDVILVTFSIVELSVDSVRGLSFIRILRVFRLIRVVRLVRTVPTLRQLRTMIFSILSSISCLLWAFLLIFLVIFIFSILFVTTVSLYFDSVDLSDPEQVKYAHNVNEHFGSMRVAAASLWASISGGNDWMMYANLLTGTASDESSSHVIFGGFTFYIAFCQIGLLNVVTGMFVDSAVATRTHDEVVETFQTDLNTTTEEVKRIFKEADTDQSGHICFKEFCKHLENPWVRAYFSGLDLDVSDARIIFTLLDVDGDDFVSIDEFVEGALKMKGSAKCIDMMALMFDQLRFTIRMSKLCSFVEEQTKEIKEMLAPGSTEDVPSTFETHIETIQRLSSNGTNQRVLRNDIMKGFSGLAPPLPSGGR
eukprot:TRINITY_DN24394_c0_g1_i1.p1 TRINITY_DN24394_c0_g1~~TRINITY_DN24394_c0_g1_i1.p1  ORF type:complete len:689 (+),score=98.26 TRINITY_DN24394_c0_g1_i1:23-2068(+)